MCAVCVCLHAHMCVRSVRCAMRVCVYVCARVHEENTRARGARAYSIRFRYIISTALRCWVCACVRVCACVVDTLRSEIFSAGCVCMCTRFALACAHVALMLIQYAFVCAHRARVAVATAPYVPCVCRYSFVSNNFPFVERLGTHTHTAASAR